jgi:hypothetical protein
MFGLPRFALLETDVTCSVYLRLSGIFPNSVQVAARHFDR